MGEALKTVKAPAANKETIAAKIQKSDFSQSNSSAIDQVLFLQRTVGNQAVQRFMKSGALQAKLRIGQPGDKYEQEADRVAQQVTQMSEPAVQLKHCPFAKGSSCKEKEENLQAKEVSGRTTQNSKGVESKISNFRGGGQPLPEPVRDYMEQRIGHDFSGVRVHSGAAAGQSARDVNAHAYTIGNNIVFGAGRFAPETNEGRRLIAHELTHVVQQSGTDRNSGVQELNLQRDDDKNAKQKSFELTNKRFSPIKRLRDIAAGGKPLSKKDNGRPVKAVQKALLDLGYSLLRFHDDSNYGTETAEAINQFNADHQPASTDKLDSISLLVLDRLAPPAGKAQEHYVDYERLLADDKLDFTLAIGYDEGKAHEKKADIARTWLKDHGFNLNSAGSIPVLERYSVKKDITYPTSDGTKKTKNIKVVINLLTPGKNAASNLGKALNESEIAIYSGHARRGVGPDFDDKKSPAENFVIGIDSALHKARGSKLKLPTDPKHTEVVRDGVNDIESMTRSGVWNEARYRVWFFNACTTLAYMDELRGGLLPGQMNRKNLDIFGTNKTVPTAAGIHTSLSFIEGILNAKTMEQILVAMNRKSAEVLKGQGTDESEIKSYRNAYFREGAGDNPVAR